MVDAWYAHRPGVHGILLHHDPLDQLAHAAAQPALALRAGLAPLPPPHTPPHPRCCPAPSLSPSPSSGPSPISTSPHPTRTPSQVRPQVAQPAPAPRVQASLCNQLLPQMDGFVKAVVTLVPEVLGPAGQELEGPLKAESEKREEVRATLPATLCLLSACASHAHCVHTICALHARSITPCMYAAPHARRRCWWRC